MVLRGLEVPGTRDRRRLDPVAGCLVGSRCADCSMTSWPRRAVCQRCGAAPMDEAAFAPTGKLLSFTTVWVARPGLEPPYTLAQVKLDEDGPAVFAHVRSLPSDARVDLPVRTVIAEEPSAVPPYWFEPL